MNLFWMFMNLFNFWLKKQLFLSLELLHSVPWATTGHTVSRNLDEYSEIMDIKTVNGIYVSAIR